jgi:two-component system nitrate/nitrite response regulator NarL
MKSLTQEIRILLVDDHAMFREGLARSFEKEPDLKVVGQCSSTAEAIALLKTGVTMVLLDVDLGAGRGLEFVEAANRIGFEGQILVVTAGISGQEAVQLIQSGVAGIMHKQHSSVELCATIRRVAAGERWLEKEYLSPLFRSVDRTRLSSRPKLTERDRTVLRCILQGLSNKDIAARLNISEGAVKASIRQLFEKLGSRTRAQLVRIALEQYKDEL